MAFRECVDQHLSANEIEEIRVSCDVIGGNPKAEEWNQLLGFTPDDKSFYEIELYKRSEECPYIEKSYVKILVPRNRDTDECNFIWRPVVGKYEGPWFR